MPATGRFIDQEDVKDFLGEDVFVRIYDDEETGAVKEEAVQLLIEEAEAEVFGAAVVTYSPDVLPSTPTEAKTTDGGKLLRSISLRMARACAFRRHPEVPRTDPAPEIKSAERMVEHLREAKIVLYGLDVDPANVGGEVIPDDQDLDEPKQFWLGDGGTGIF
jgi:hypothetical protein